MLGQDENLGCARTRPATGPSVPRTLVPPDPPCHQASVLGALFLTPRSWFPKTTS